MNDEEFKNDDYCPKCGTKGTIWHRGSRTGEGVSIGKVTCLNPKCPLSVNGRTAYLTYG